MEDRKFCRFNSGPSTTVGEIVDDPVLTKRIPEGGFCISAFVVLREHGKRNNILFGKVNTSADWVRLGALDKSRVELFRNGWMLPSSHLIVHESPAEAADRILTEQLGLGRLKLRGPIVVSETYKSALRSDGPDHWDMHMIFTGTVPADRIRQNSAWQELKFINTASPAAHKVVRNHMDIVRFSSPAGKGTSA